MTKKLSFLIAGTLLLFGLVSLFRIENIGTTALWSLSDGGKWLLPLIGVAALIDSINPCAFSILLLTIAFLLIGLGLLHTLHIFDTPHFMAKVGATLLVALGLINIINEMVPAFPFKLSIPQAAHRKIAVLMEKASVPTAVVLGGLVGLCEFPCTGGPYLMVLGLLHDHATYYTGVGYLFVYNLIFILPLVLILLVASDKGLLNKVQAWQQSERKAMRWGGGVAMIMLGAVVFAV